MNKLVTALAVAGASVSLAACGSDSNSSSGGTLSKSDLVAKVNKICETAINAAKAVPAPTSLQDSKQAAAYFDKIAPITQKETDDLLALKPADDVKADYAAFTSAQKQANDLLMTIKDKAEKADASGLKDLAKIGPIGQKVASTANKLGASSCSS